MDIRPYDHAADFDAIRRFLIQSYVPAHTLRNWLEPRWVYMHYHPLIEGLPLERIGLFEEGGTIVGMVNFEHSVAFVYFQTRPGLEHVQPVMFEYAVEHFGGGSDPLGVFISDTDAALIELAKANGLSRDPRGDEPHSRFTLGEPIPESELPDGFRLQSLEAENDLARINAVLWRGFDHGDVAPDEEIPGRKHMQEAPGFRKDLTIVCVAPNGDYASFAGMWIVPENRVAYVEPVATDPAYRRMGLGAAAVLEGLRRVADLGAEVAWVGADLPFYRSIGFVPGFRNELWRRAH